MARNKKEVYEELFRICEEDTIEEMVKYLADFFDTVELAGLLEHIKEEKCIITNDDNEDEDEEN